MAITKKKRIRDLIHLFPVSTEIHLFYFQCVTGNYPIIQDFLLKIYRYRKIAHLILIVRRDNLISNGTTDHGQATFSISFCI